MAKSKQSIVLTRREALLLSTTAGLGAALGKPAFGSDSVKTGAHQEPGNVTTPPTAVAKTQYGKVRGFVDGGVLTFKGVPYGATTAGENRWLPAKSPAPWRNEYPAPVRRELPTDPAPVDEHRADVFIRLGRRLAERGHVEAEHLDAKPDRKAARDVLHARRRVQLRIIVRTAIA